MNPTCRAIGLVQNQQDLGTDGRQCIQFAALLDPLSDGCVGSRLRTRGGATDVERHIDLEAQRRHVPPAARRKVGNNTGRNAQPVHGGGAELELRPVVVVCDSTHMRSQLLIHMGRLLDTHDLSE